MNAITLHGEISSMLTLHFAPGSSSMAPHIMLHEIGVPFDTRVVSFAAKQQRSAEFHSINPEGRVPVLVLDDGSALTEVAAILYYLARTHSTVGMWPTDNPATEARIISWMSFCASTLHPARRQGLEKAKEIYALADRRLGNSDWVADRYSIADIHLFRLYWRLKASLKPEPQLFPALDAHHARMMQCPAVKRTIAVESAIGYELPS